MKKVFVFTALSLMVLFFSRFAENVVGDVMISAFSVESASAQGRTFTLSPTGRSVPTGELYTPEQIEGVTGQQYDRGLRVGGGDLKNLVVIVTNYALGFVGLIALTAVIYAGFLYIANFGNDELTGKAKNILLYAGVGIVVIILSYAFVNALVAVVREDNTLDTGSGTFTPGTSVVFQCTGDASPDNAKFLQSTSCIPGQVCYDAEEDGSGLCRNLLEGSGLPCNLSKDCLGNETCFQKVCFQLDPFLPPSGGTFPPTTFPGSTIAPFPGGAPGGDSGTVRRTGNPVQDLILAFNRLGDVCPFTISGLRVDDVGCAANQFLADTDGDGVINTIDPDDDGDSVGDGLDDDIDGDRVRNPQDVCSDTLSFPVYKLHRLNTSRPLAERISRASDYVVASNGCAVVYQLSSDIDGDGVVDPLDCDADADGKLDDSECLQSYEVNIAAPSNPGTTSPNQSVLMDPLTSDPLGLSVQVQEGEIDSDDDNDGVEDFGENASQQQRLEALVSISRSFEELDRSIRTTCARLPQTVEVQSFCAFRPDDTGVVRPVGSLVKMLDELVGTRFKLEQLNEFDRLFREFQQLIRGFPRVNSRFESDLVEGELGVDGSAFPVNFDASRTVDPHEEICPTADDDYSWFVNQTIDWSKSMDDIVAGRVASGVLYRHEFREPGVYNVQLLVRSACTLGEVVPQSVTPAVDAAMAGLATLKIRVLSPRAVLDVRIDGHDDPGFSRFPVLTRDQVMVRFDMTHSTTNRGPFQRLTYSCENAENQVIQATEKEWKFECGWQNPSGSRRITLTAEDRVGRIGRIIDLVFRNVVAYIDTTPALLTGTVETEFVFDGTSSRARGGTLDTWTWAIYKEQVAANGAVTYDNVLDESGENVLTHRFTQEGAGRYLVRLTVSVGSGEPAEFEVLVTVVPRQPIPVFTALFSDPLFPGRVVLDARDSFHPDFPNDAAALSFSWKIDGANLHAKTGASDPGPFFERVGGAAGDDRHVFYDFGTKGQHDIELTVTRGEERSSLSRTVDVRSVLGVDFDIGKRAVRIGDSVLFTPRSPLAVGFFWNFGDDFTMVSDGAAVHHKYEKQGRYMVKLEVEDTNGDTNSVTKVLRVGMANEPLAVIRGEVQGHELIPEGSVCNGGITVTRRDSVILNGSDSLSVRGDSSGLDYLWEISSDLRTRGTTTSIRFDELTDATCENAVLTVTDRLTGVSDTARLGIRVENLEPQLSGIRPSLPTRNVTPVTVSVQVIGDRDADGRVQEYKWWYYAEGRKAEKLGLHTTQSPSTSFVLGPRGPEGVKVTYYFVVELTDNDGDTVVSEDEIGKSEGVAVVNGPNIVPQAEFMVDRTSLKVGERVTFTSTTKDPLDEYIPTSAYQWDFEGDAKYEKGVTGPKVTYVYNRPGAYTPTLRVVKNGVSTTYNMKLQVIPDTARPEAAFLFVKSGIKVVFINNSIVDPQLKDKDIFYAWDFDTKVDTDGNGIPEDDSDSAMPNPEWEFEGTKDYEVRLVVKDSMGSTDDVRRVVEFLVKDKRGALGRTMTERLKPALNTNPERNSIDGKLYIVPPTADVVFNARASTGKIQEYRIDTNLYVDSDGDGLRDNDVDNKTHASWKDGSNFRFRYGITDGRIRAGLLLVGTDGTKKGTAIDIVFAKDNMEEALSLQLQDPDKALTVLETIPVVSFDASTDFARVGESIVFDASRTRFPDEQVKEFLWDFDGDGLVEEVSFEPTYEYSYPKEGVYQVILEAESERGLTGEYSRTVIVRGGLSLPEAKFTYEKEGQAVTFTNASTVDPSFPADAVAYEWRFVKVDLGSGAPWLAWQRREEYRIGEDEEDDEPLWVNRISWQKGGDLKGVLPRAVALGDGVLMVQFEEGEVLADGSAAFGGELVLSPVEGLEVPSDQPRVAAFSTGVERLLRLEKGVSVVIDRVVREAELWGVSGEPVMLGKGRIANDRTVFSTTSFGGTLVVVGVAEAAVAQEEVLGVSSVKDPVKIFDSPGTYRVVLTVTDGVGEVGETQQVITVSEADTAVATVPPEQEEGTALSSPNEEVEEGGVSDPTIEGEIPSSGSSNIPPPSLGTDEKGFSVWSVLLGLMMLLGGGAGATILVQLVRRRMAEVQRLKSAVPSSGVVEEGEVVAEVAPKAGVPSAPLSGVEVVKKEEVVLEKKPVPTVGVEKKPVEEKKGSEVKKKEEGPKGADGPIPDWLK